MRACVNHSPNSTFCAITWQISVQIFSMGSIQSSFPSHTSYAGLGADQGDHKTHRCTSLFEHNFVIQTKMNRDISEHHTSNNKTKKTNKKQTNKQQQQQQKQHHEHLNLWQNSPRINKKFRTTIRMSAYCVILKTTPDSCYWNVVSTCPKRDEGMW